MLRCGVEEQEVMLMNAVRTHVQNYIAKLAVVPIPSSVAEQIRATLRDDFGNVLKAVESEGGAPCRHCLRLTVPGERVILFSYRPFAAPCPYQEIGPIFIHADGCARFEGDRRFPEAFRERPGIVRPYTARHEIADAQEIARPGQLLDAATRMLEIPDVSYVHVRSLTRGCYLFRIERVELS
jgi:hypothetical protein